MNEIILRIKRRKMMKHIKLNFWRSIMLTMVVALVAVSVASVPILAQGGMKSLPNIVLVHGAWADGSSWSGVIQRLQKDGYNVTAPQFPMTTLADNDARLREVLNAETGPTIVVGHSYGGEIMPGLCENTPTVLLVVSLAST